MEEVKPKEESLSNHLTDYIETYFKLTVVNATQKATAVASVSLVTILVTFFFVFVLLFGGAGCSMWIGESLGNMKAGYFLVGGFYFLCALIVILIRKSILFPMVRNNIIRKVYETPILKQR
jgi:hypothetical protein